MQTICAEMEQIGLYKIAYKGLKVGSYIFDFKVDNALFEAYETEEIKGGNCDVHVELNRTEAMLELNISIHTVMSHRKNITHKTGIKSVAGLTVYALLNNLLDQNDVTL